MQHDNTVFHVHILTLIFVKWVDRFQPWIGLRDWCFNKYFVIEYLCRRRRDCRCRLRLTYGDARPRTGFGVASGWHSGRHRIVFLRVWTRGVSSDVRPAGFRPQRRFRDRRLKRRAGRSVLQRRGVVHDGRHIKSYPVCATCNMSDGATTRSGSPRRPLAAGHRHTTNDGGARQDDHLDATVSNAAIK